MAPQRSENSRQAVTVGWCGVGNVGCDPPVWMVSSCECVDWANFLMNERIARLAGVMSIEAGKICGSSRTLIHLVWPLVTGAGAKHSEGVVFLWTSNGGFI